MVLPTCIIYLRAYFSVLVAIVKLSLLNNLGTDFAVDVNRRIMVTRSLNVDPVSHFKLVKHY